MTEALELMKPYLLLAALAFVIGFASYLAVARPTPAVAHGDEAFQARVHAAPTSDDWNVPKHI